MTARRSSGVPRNCEQGFEKIALACLDEIRACQATAARGNVTGIHRMRIAITRLRAARRFFSPMVTDRDWRTAKGEIGWLNDTLGRSRDDEVLFLNMRKLASLSPAPEGHQGLAEQVLKHHARVAEALSSHRYRHLLAALSNWIEQGPWRSFGGTADLRKTSLSRYAARRLERWSIRLARRMRHKPSEKRLHRIRIEAKQFRYMGDALSNAGVELSAKHSVRQGTARRIQAKLGDLRDLLRADATVGFADRAAFAKTKRKLLRKAHREMSDYRKQRA